jgi:hypothetical protein
MPRYSAKQRKMRGGRPTSGRPFVRLWWNVIDSDKFAMLDAYGIAALVHLTRKYNGCNNGLIPMGVRELARKLRCSQGTACNALRQLDDAGLAHPMQVGLWRGRRPTEWRLTFNFCNKTSAPAVHVWKPAPEFTEESAKVHVGKLRVLRVHVGKRKSQKAQ